MRPARYWMARGGLGLGILAALWLGLGTDLDPGHPAVTRMAAVAVLMALWWVTEALPLAATALVPLVALPLLGIAPAKVVAGSYINSTIFLFIGGFLIAQAMERWHLHRRIALAVVGIFGGRPGALVLGFMMATALLSMWISNTATTVMMVPIAVAILDGLALDEGEASARAFAVALLLGIAYAASIGGVATLVGTPPNLALARIYQISFPGSPAIAFGQWMLLGVPVALVMLLAAWLLLTRGLYPQLNGLRLSLDALHRERLALGPVTWAQWSVALVFGLTALLWIFRKDLDLGFARIPGWSGWLPWARGIDDGTVAIGMALSLFLLPAREGRGGTRLLEADAFGRLPWGVVVLFGGGFALAKGFADSGLSAWLGGHFLGAGHLGRMTLVATVTSGVTGLTELTSNTATTQLILPVLAAAARGVGLTPLQLMVPATLAASFAFMLPVATPPNAVVFGTGRVRIGDMVRAGIWLNLAGILTILAAARWLLPLVFGP